MLLSSGQRRQGSPSTSLAVLLLLFTSATLMVATQTSRLRLVSTAWSPFTNESGQARFALDLVEAAFGRFGMSATTTIVDPDAFTTALLNGPFDGSAAAWKDAERERALVFSQAYLENRLVLVGRRGANVSAAALADLKGKRVAIVGGYAYGDGIDSAGPTFVRSKTEEDSLSLLLASSVDYTLMDELVVEYIVSHYPTEVQSKLQLGSTPLMTRPLYLAVRRSLPDANSIVARFNAQLRGMIADRTYHRLLHVDWIRADINDDGVTENVPSPDRPSAAEPQRIYTLFSTSQTASETEIKPGFYVGGSLYSDWASVPESYKAGNTQQPDPRRSTASLFKFSW